MGLTPPQRRPLPGPAAILRRLLTAALLAALIVAIASAALFVTAAPAPVSLLFEPLSLLLIPGLLMAVALTGSHADVSASTALVASAAFYFALFYIVLARLGARTHPRSG